MRELFSLFLIVFPLGAWALEEGDKCSDSQNLPPQLTCFNGEIYVCSNGGQGRMGYVACEGAKMSRLEAEQEKRYQALLKKLQKPAKFGADFALVRSSLTKSQKAWEQFVTADCNLTDSLLGTGNASAGVGIDCYNNHIKERIEQLKSIENSLQ